MGRVEEHQLEWLNYTFLTFANFVFPDAGGGNSSQGTSESFSEPWRSVETV